MRKLVKLSAVALAVWLVAFYGHALAVMPAQAGSRPSVLHSSQDSGYWSADPALSQDDSGWDRRVWKWHEFLGCGSSMMMGSDPYNYSRRSPDGSEMGLLSPPDLDWVYVSGLSTGSVWDDLAPSYQPPPLGVGGLGSLVLETRIAGWKGAPLSPVIIPSWYALLTDVWFNVTNVVVEKDGGTEHYDSKILGMDIFYHTMTGSLNTVMGAGNEFSRIEPCNENFVYSVNLAGQELYSVNDGLYVIDLLALLQRAQQAGAEQGWHFSIDDAELVMLETVVESYWSYVYAEVAWSGIRYCAHVEERCAIK